MADAPKYGSPGGTQAYHGVCSPLFNDHAKKAGLASSLGEDVLDFRTYLSQRGVGGDVVNMCTAWEQGNTKPK